MNNLIRDLSDVLKKHDAYLEVCKDIDYGSTEVSIIKYSDCEQQRMLFKHGNYKFFTDFKNLEVE